MKNHILFHLEHDICHTFVSYEFLETVVSIQNHIFLNSFVWLFQYILVFWYNYQHHIYLNMFVYIFL